MIRGTTSLIAHIGYPTDAFKSPMIYNPWFERRGIDAVVMPMGALAEDYPQVLRAVFKLTNIRGALITMPHKVTTASLVDTVTAAVEIAGSCNAVRREPDGRLHGDMFDGAGFVRGVRRKGVRLAGARALVVGSGGVGSAIAAALAAEQVRGLGLYDTNPIACHALADRVRQRYPSVEIRTDSNDPAGFDLVINATPLGMNDSDPLPLDPSRLASSTFVGEVVMKQEMTAFLRAAAARGCAVQVGTDMLFEQIPAYLEFFGYPVPTPDELRAVARLS